MNNLFTSIKDTLKKPQTNSFKDILKLEVGKTYTVRLIPNVKKPESTFFHYYTHGWKSFTNNNFIIETSPTTYEQPDPISEIRGKILKSGSAIEKEKIAGVVRKESWLVKVWVIEDQSKPENNGSVKILRFGKQLHKIIMSAMEEDADELGERIFDLSKNGCNLVIKCEKQGDFPSFVSSKFKTKASAIEGLDSEAKIKEVLANPIELASLVQVKSYNDLKKLFTEDFYGEVKEEAPAKAPAKAAKAKAEPADDDIPYADPKTSIDEDVSIDSLLDGLNKDNE